MKRISHLLSAFFKTVFIQILSSSKNSYFEVLFMYKVHVCICLNGDLVSIKRLGFFKAFILINSTAFNNIQHKI